MRNFISCMAVLIVIIIASIISSCGGTEEDEVIEVDLDLGLEDISFDDMKPAGFSNSTVILPLDEKTCITSNFGPRNGGFHEGIDLRTVNNSRKTVYAVSDGRVVKGERGNGHAGLFVKIYHPELRIYSIYAHLSEKYVKAGDRVRGGETIGIAGETGRTFGEHLHFGIKNEYNRSINPQKWLQQNLVFIQECPKIR